MLPREQTFSRVIFTAMSRQHDYYLVTFEKWKPHCHPGITAPLDVTS
jgi:hypothetical protein